MDYLRTMKWRIIADWAVRTTVVCVASLAAMALVGGEIGGAWMDAFCAMWASVAGFALALLSVPASVDGAVVDAEAFSAIIVPECTALEYIIVFGAAALAFPVSIGARLRGLLLGVAALFALNIVRIASLMHIGISHPNLLEYAHLEIWRPAMALATVGLYILWLLGVSSASIGNAPTIRRWRVIRTDAIATNRTKTAD